MPYPLELVCLDALHVEDLADCSAKSAHRQLWRPLHEDDKRILLNGVVDLLARFSAKPTGGCCVEQGRL